MPFRRPLLPLHLVRAPSSSVYILCGRGDTCIPSNHSCGCRHSPCGSNKEDGDGGIAAEADGDDGRRKDDRGADSGSSRRDKGDRSGRHHRDRDRDERSSRRRSSRSRSKDREKDRHSSRRHDRDDRDRRDRGGSGRRSDRDRSDRDRTRRRSRSRSRSRERSRRHRSPSGGDRRRRRSRSGSRERDSKRSPGPDELEALRKQAAIDELTKDQRTVFVTQLVMRATDHDLRSFFGKVGKVKNVIMIRDKHTNRHKGFAYVEMQDLEVIPAVLALNNTVPDFQKFPVGIKASEAERNYLARQEAAATAATAATAGVPPPLAGSAAGAAAGATGAAAGLDGAGGVPSLPFAAGAPVAPGGYPSVVAPGGYPGVVPTGGYPRVVPAGGYPGVGMGMGMGAPVGGAGMGSFGMYGSGGGGGAAMPVAAVQQQNTVRVSNLHPSITEADLMTMLLTCGEVQSVTLEKDGAGQSKGSAIATFAERSSAEQCLEQFNGLDIAQKALEVSWVKIEAPRPMPMPGVPYAGVLAAPMNPAMMNPAVMAALQAALPPNARLGLPMAAPEMAGAGAAAGPAAAGAKPPIAGAPSLCLKICNMFDPATETEDGWDLDIKEDVEEECGKHGKVLHCFVDTQDPTGVVFVALASVAAAVRSAETMNGRWFAGRMIQVAYVPHAEYVQKFPEAQRALRSVSEAA
ncbi:unnamed protein product [Phaeothamnion confervicola]